MRTFKNKINVNIITPPTKDSNVLFFEPLNGNPQVNDRIYSHPEMKRTGKHSGSIVDVYYLIVQIIATTRNDNTVFAAVKTLEL